MSPILPNIGAGTALSPNLAVGLGIGEVGLRFAARPMSVL